MLTPFVLPLEEQALLTTLLTQPHRHYHNINHINDCLAELYKWWEQHESLYYLIKDLTYAVWYHDIIYNPYVLAGINEYQSANLFDRKHRPVGEHAHLCINLLKMAYNVYNAIIATTHHTQNQEPDFLIDKLKNVDINVIKLMLDIDLSGLGSQPELYARNSYNIRKEYYNTSDITFVKGRLDFLYNINKRESFYYMDYFKDLYHTQSKENVKNEIIALEDAVNRNDIEFYYGYIRDEMLYARGG